MDTCNVLNSIPDGLIGTVIVVFIFVRFLEKYIARKEQIKPSPETPGRDYYPPG